MGDCIKLCLDKGCDLSLLADGNCDKKCNNIECYYDGGDCSMNWGTCKAMGQI